MMRKHCLLITSGLVLLMGCADATSGSSPGSSDSVADITTGSSAPPVSTLPDQAVQTTVEPGLTVSTSDSRVRDTVSRTSLGL